MQVAGQAGVPGDADAVILNVTATNTDADGFVTLWPCGSSMPDASNLNFVRGHDVPNSVVARLGSGGKVCLKASAKTNLLVDAAGYLPAGSGYEPTPNPVRILDTRSGNGAPAGVAPAGSTVRLGVAGRGGVPSGAESVVLNVTAAATQGYGYVTVFPCDQPQPVASNLNYVSGQDVPNLVMTRVAADGTICLYTYGAAHLIADVSGYFASSSDYRSIANPTRILDTRNGMGRVGSGSVIEWQVAGLNGVPADVGAVALNVTVTDPLAAGYASVYPCGQGAPNASNLNYTSGQSIANLAVVRVSATGSVCLYASQATHVIADVAGFFPAGSTYVALAVPTRLLDTRTIPAPAPPAPPDPPAPPAGGLLPGTTLIGSQAAPGRYIAQEAVAGCYWERLSGLSGEFEDIIANDFRAFTGRVIVDIAPSDVAFKFDSECGRFWPYALSMTPVTSIHPGDWLVGSEILPGTYTANVGSGCYWERLTSFSGELEAIIDNDFVASAGVAYLTIEPSDIGFHNDADCGSWTRIA